MAKMKQTTVIKNPTKGQAKIIADTMVLLGMGDGRYKNFLYECRGYSALDPLPVPGGWHFVGYDADGDSMNAWNSCHEKNVVSFGEFMELLYASAAMGTPSVTKLGSHDLTYAKDHIMVGCTRVEKTQIEEILKYMNDMK